MIFLLLSIFCSTALMLIFKLFKKFEISTFHAIVFNYLTAVFIGIPFVNDWEFAFQSAGNWYYLALLLGSLFIGLFFLIGKTTQELGISVATVAMKLGYILPILLAFTWYKEELSTLKISAILLTILAVILSSIKKKDLASQPTAKNSLLIFLPLVIFIGSGICDALVQFAEKSFFPNKGFEAFLIILFATAFSLGFFAAIISDIRKKQSAFTAKNIFAGFLLGIPNYGSIYFLFKALNHYSNDSASVFPLNNIGIVLLSSLVAIFFFQEKLSKWNLLGLTIALLSIILMSFEHLF
ncbi:MAG: DMT family transporter [Chitinophagales bacterium]